MAHAIVIGIDKYWDAQSDLEHAVDDAIGFAAWLISSEAMPAENVHLFIERRAGSSPLPSALSDVRLTNSAAFAAIVDAMEKVAARLRAQDEKFYFYFAGHGLQWTDGEIRRQLLCCSDFDPATSSRGRNHLTVEGVQRLFRARPVPVQFFFVDACRNFPKGRDFKPQTIFFSVDPELNVDQLLLRATSAGQEVVDGNFTPCLLRMLNEGEGSCKAYDGKANAYIITWDSLCDQLMSGSFPQLANLRPQATKDHMKYANPELCRFPADRFRAKVDVRLMSPKPADGTLICRPCHSPHTKIEDVFQASATQVDIPQGDYTMQGLAEAVEYFPSRALVRIYDSETVVDLFPPGGAAVAPQVFQTDRQGQRSKSSDLAAPQKSRSIKSVGSEPDNNSRLHLSTADPLTQLLVSRAGGTVIEAESGRLSLDLSPGAYRLAARGAADGGSSLDIAIGTEYEVAVAVELPDTSTALAKALAAATGHPIENGLFRPSGADAAPIAQADAADVVAHALVNGAWNDRLPNTALRSIVSIFIDESDGARTRHRAARLWEQYEKNDGMRVELESLFGPQVLAWSGEPGPGTYWLEGRDRQAGVRSGFKQSIWVPPGHLLLHIVHRRGDCSMTIYQIALHRNHANGESHAAIRHSLWLQKAMETGISAPSWPIVKSLIADEWFEPIAALLVATALAGNASDLAKMLLDRLADRAPGSIDVSVLMKRLGRDDTMELHLRPKRSPILSENLHALVAMVRAERKFGREQRWLAEKAKQDAGHPLWMLRREDDKKGGRIPLAISAIRQVARLLSKSRDPLG